MKKTLSFKLCIIVFYLLVFIAFIIEKRPILSNSTPYFSRIANVTNLVPFYYNPNSNYQALQMNIIMKVFLVMPIALYYVIKKDCTLGQLITFILGASFIFEVAKLLSLRGFLILLISSIIWQVLPSLTISIEVSSSLQRNK